MTVIIRLKENHTNIPIRSVRVRLYPENKSGYIDKTTDNNGIARFNFNEMNYEDGKYTIKIRSPNHRPYTKKTWIETTSDILIELDKAYP